MLWPLIALSIVSGQLAVPSLSDRIAVWTRDHPGYGGFGRPRQCYDVLSLDPSYYPDARLSVAVEDLAVGVRQLGVQQLGTVRPVPEKFAPPLLPNDSQRHELLSLRPSANPNNDPLGQISQAVDVISFDHPLFQADVVSLLAPTGTVQPFAAIAHQYDDLDDSGRMGIGAGTKWTISPNANFGTELLFLPRGAAPTADADLPHYDMQLMTRLEVNF